MDIKEFFTSTNPPRYGHQLNWAESLGNALLFLNASSLGTFAIKNGSITSKIIAVAIMVFTSPLTLLGAIVKGIGYAWPHKEILATDINIKPTTEMKLRQCYDLAAAMKKVFLEQGLTRQQNGEEQPLFFMVSGTALGAVRHGGIIPWDDDCDFGIFKEDEPKFLQLKEALKREGIEIHDLRYESTYKLRFTNEKIKELYGREVSSSEIGENDLFVFDKMSDGCYTYDTILSRSRWPTEFFTPQDVIDGFEMVPFGPPEKGLTLPLLKKPDEYLARYYGANFKDYGVETHGHLCLDLGKLGSIAIPFFKLGAHYFKIEQWKDIPATWP